MSSRKLIFSARRKDFRVDRFKSGGKGGQHQNKTDSGVRITHMETGLGAESRSSRSQHQNKKAAFRKLVDKLTKYVLALEKKEMEISTEVIRTYHEPDNRVKDHASGERMSFVAAMDDITPLIEARRNAVLRKDKK